MKPLNGFALNFYTILVAIGLVATYAIVLLQFKIDEIKWSKLPTPNKLYRCTSAIGIYMTYIDPLKDPFSSISFQIIIV